MVAGLLPFAEQLPMDRAHRRSCAAITDRRRICNSLYMEIRKYLNERSPDCFQQGLPCKKRHRPTLPPVTAIPSALAGLTALFGMGRGRHRRYRHLKIFIGLSYDNISSSGQLTYILKELRFFFVILFVSKN